MADCRKSEMDQLRLKSALDLREEPHACKKAAEHNVITGVAIAPVQVPLVGNTTVWCSESRWLSGDHGSQHPRLPQHAVSSC